MHTIVARRDLLQAHPGLAHRLYRAFSEAKDLWWPYGITANRTTLDTYLRYHHEQGLSTTRHRIEDIVTPDLLET